MRFGLVVLLACMVPEGASAQASSESGGSSEPVQVQTNLQLWGYGSRIRLVDGSVINPANQALKLSRDTFTVEARPDLTVKAQRWDLSLRPRLVVTRERSDFGARSSSEASVSQGFGRIRANDEIVLTAGRELFTWGPAYFRSPSNPFYFDAGKTRPLQDVPGADLVRLTATMNSLSISTAFVEQGSSIPASKRHSRVIKADYRGADYSLGGIWSGTTRDSQFLGGFAQFTVDDALLLYAEGSSMPRDSTAPGSPGRPLNGLIGGAYTFDSGKSLAVEILHDQRGFTLQAERAYFEQAANRGIATQLGGVMPPLLGRSYLYVLWQSNLQDTSRYWRVSLTENVLDHSRQFQAYAELPAGTRLTLFGSLVQNFGPLRSEFASVVRTSFTLGIKAFAF